MVGDINLYYLFNKKEEIEMPFGSVLANANTIALSTADDKTVQVKGFLPKMALRFIGIPHLGMRVRAAAVFEHLDLSKTDIVLDAGCGSGTYSFTIGFKGNTIYGVDSDMKKIKECQRMSEEMKMGSNVYFYKADISKLPFDNNFFDKIIFSEVMEHTENDQAAINELHRVLKPGGIMVITVPSDIYINQLYKDDFGHTKLYTIEMVQKLIKDKFEIVGVSRRNKLIGQLAWILNRKMFFSKVLAALTFYPIYALTLLDWYGPGRELIVSVRK
jgi:ubiquinone/menaquinone biosynthesis C-methylase UbiE